MTTAEEGRLEGPHQGRAETLRRQLGLRFGRLPESVTTVFVDELHVIVAAGDVLEREARARGRAQSFLDSIDDPVLE